MNFDPLAHSSNPTIVVDVAKIRIDQALLMPDTQVLVPTLRPTFGGSGWPPTTVPR